MKTIDFNLKLSPSDKKNNLSLYASMHIYVRKKYQKTGICHICKKEPKTRIEMDLIKGRDYSYNVEDYMELCPSCHKKYDVTEEYIEKCRKRQKEASKESFLAATPDWIYKKGADNPTSKPIIKSDINGNFIKEYVSLTEASLDLGIILPSLCNCLKGTSKSAGGFKWKYKNK
jgi:hypothetical protein